MNGNVTNLGPSLGKGVSFFLCFFFSLSLSLSLLLLLPLKIPAIFCPRPSDIKFKLMCNLNDCILVSLNLLNWKVFSKFRFISCALTLFFVLLSANKRLIPVAGRQNILSVLAHEVTSRVIVGHDQPLAVLRLRSSNTELPRIFPDDLRKVPYIIISLPFHLQSP